MSELSVKERMRYKKLSKKLKAFGFGTLQDTRNVINALRKNDIEIMEFMRWVEHMKSTKNRATHNRVLKENDNREYKCPYCGLPLTLIPVNTMPCNRVEERYNSMLYCYDDLGCGYELYSDKPAHFWEELSAKIGANVFDISRENGNSGTMEEVLRTLGIATNHKPLVKTADKPCGGCKK